MTPWHDKQTMVAGLGPTGQAACALLRREGARVTAWSLPGAIPSATGLEVLLESGVRALAPGSIEWPPGLELVVTDPDAILPAGFVQDLRARGVRLISELELGSQSSLCLNVTITGTNGKTTTAGLVERLLTQTGRRTLVAGDNGTPVSSVAGRTRELDFLTLEAGALQLEHIECFRPAVAVVMNLTPDHADRYPSMAAYVKATARIFANQQSFDWAIVQSEALARMRELNLPIPSKTITFSAANRRADLVLERGLLISRLDDWSGPLLGLEQCGLRGPHNAENIMAALAVGRVLRIPLEEMVAAVRDFSPLPHRCETLAEAAGVRFVNDSKCTNPGALEQALLAMPGQPPGEPNVWLIAGGRDRGGDFHALGPLLSQRVKEAFLIGETREKLRAAWGLFTPCTLVGSLLEAVTQAASAAVPGDIILLSPACSSFDMFQGYQHRGEVYRQAVAQWLLNARRTAPPTNAALTSP